VSSAYIDSQVCRSERRYSIELGKPLLPVAVEHTRPELLPPEISRIHIVDYSAPSEEAAIELAVAISGIRPAGPLPAPSPLPPPVPTSHLSLISQEIAVDSLTLDEQLALAGKLEGAIQRAADTEEQAAVIDLLRRLDQRRDLYAETARTILRILDARPAATNTTAPTDHHENAPAARAPYVPSDYLNAKSWKAELIDAPSYKTTWCVRIHLEHEEHIVELRTGRGFTLADELLIDDQLIWKGQGRQIGVPERDFDVTMARRCEL
jgi:hypothetical protein